MSLIAEKNVAIVGSSPSVEDERISYGPDYEIWAASGLQISLPRCDRWFEIGDHVEHRTLKDSRNFQRLRGRAALIYRVKPVLDKPESIPYPQEMVTKALKAYFTGSLSYMVALAIYEAFDRISLYGVQLSSSENHEEKANVEYLLGIAKGRGIKIELSNSSGLLKASQFYGYGRVSLYDHLWARLWRMNDERYRLRKEIDVLRERINAMKDSNAGLKPSANTWQRRERELATQLAKLEGSMEESRFWMAWANDTEFDEK